MKLEFSRRILENPKNPNIMKIHEVGDEFFLAVGRKDGQTYGWT